MEDCRAGFRHSMSIIITEMIKKAKSPPYFICHRFAPFILAFVLLKGMVAAIYAGKNINQTGNGK